MPETTDSSLFDLSQGIVPVLGGFGLLIWLVWRLFWKVDRRSQQELATKDKKIADLTTAFEVERTARLAAQQETANVKAEAPSMVAQIKALTEKVNELTAEVQSLRQQLQGGTTA